jgi:hypothetical protein
MWLYVVAAVGDPDLAGRCCSSNRRMFTPLAPVMTVEPYGADVEAVVTVVVLADVAARHRQRPLPPK